MVLWMAWGVQMGGGAASASSTAAVPTLPTSGAGQ
jgi:hypothetical protein